MLYKPFADKQLSRLGMGAMRLPATGPGYGAPIDYIQANKLIQQTHQQGVNYFDTSYFYHGGESESFIGNALKPFPRDSWYLASKMPGNLMRVDDGKLTVTNFNGESKAFDAPVDVFEFQLKRCGVEYFDFYMLHNMAEGTFDLYTDESLGIIDCLLEQKAKGRIGHLGFSSHGRAETIEQFLDYLSRRDCHAFEFAMIQLNYLDWELQQARQKYELLTRRGLSVFVMEPLRGGRLAALPPKAEALLKAARPQTSAAAWAFRFLQTLDNIPVIVSGMSSTKQLDENLRLFEADDPLSQAETQLMMQAADTLAMRVPCTTCRYCACPQGLDIPTLLTLYNEAGYEMAWMFWAAVRALGDTQKPSACTGCKQCNPLCPQGIDIPDALQKFSQMLRG